MNTSTFRLRAVVPIVAVLCWVLLQSAGAEAGRTLSLLYESPNSGDFDGTDDCIVHGFTPVGQALHASGSTGGLLPYLDDSVFDDSQRYATLRRINDDAKVLGGLEQTSEDSIIVVLDDFTVLGGTGGVYRFDDTSSDTTYSTSSDAAASVVARGSHGSMVMAQINAIIRDSEQYELVPELSNDVTTSWTNGGKRLDVVGVQLQGHLTNGYFVFDASTMAPALAAGDGRDHVVVNMSWVILPCQNISDFLEHLSRRGAGYAPTFAGYVNALKDQGADMSVSFAPGSPGGRLQSDDMNQESISFVASAGNMALDFDLYPAAFSNVFSVGALDADDYTNAAQILASGGWFPLSYLCCDGGTTSGMMHHRYAGLAYAGTSFAAPSVSVLAALRADDCALEAALGLPTSRGASALRFADVCDESTSTP